MFNSTDKLIESVKKKAINCISMYGDLRWCDAKICACMGCANHKMSKEEYELALTIPEIKEIIQKRRNTQQGTIFKLNWTAPAGCFVGRLNEPDVSQ